MKSVTITFHVISKRDMKIRLVLEAAVEEYLRRIYKRFGIL